ncbi:MAG: hypothetical protein JNM75_10525 [Rhodospirillales bacterium]|nr:hypothetical protein [Rhodospirillales bacterium]
MASEDKKNDLGQAEPDLGAHAKPATDATIDTDAGGVGEPAVERELSGAPDPAAGEAPAGMGVYEQSPQQRAEASAFGSEPADPADDDHDGRREAEAARTEPSPVAASRGGGRGGSFVAGILGGVLVLALAAAAVFLTRDLWIPPVAGMLAQHLPQQPGQGEDRMRVTESVNTLKSETADVRSQLSASTNRLASVQQELDSLRQEVGKVAAKAREPQQAAQPAQQDMSQPLEDIDQRLSQLEVGSGRLSAVEQQLETLQSSLSQVRSSVSEADDQARRPAATVLAVNQLAEALEREGGYAQELETVRVISRDDSALTGPIGQLGQWANSGIASFGELRARFPEMARAVAQSDYQREGDSWLDSVTNRLTSLVTVRKVGDAALAAGGTDAALTEAEEAMQAGNLAGAVKALGNLQGPAADAASGWLEQARNRLAAEKALADLRMAAIAQLNAARG